MKRFYHLFAPLFLGLFLFGCVPGKSNDDSERTGEMHLEDRETASTTAMRESPLRSIDQSELTRSLPIRHVFIGKDAEGRTLAVWVRGQVERYLYLDQLRLKSEQEALEAVRRNGIISDRVTAVVLSYLDRESQPVIWEIVTPEQHVWLDAQTGQVTPRKGTQKAE